MTRQRWFIVGAAGVGVAAAGVLWLIQQRAASARRTPDWTDPGQPPEGTAQQPTSTSLAGPVPRASWCASRPGDPGMRSGARVLRHYAPTLSDDPESVVR